MNTASTSRTIIITGANGNLGTAVTTLFLNRGYKVLATVYDEEAKKEMPVHPRLQATVLNLTNEEETTAFIQSVISTHHQIDGALMLVGGFAMGDIAATKNDDIKKQISLNFDTAYHVARPLLAHMLANNYGRLVFVGARPALQASAGKSMVAYGLSKSLLFKLAEYINEETKGKNVTATVVVPSTLDTAINRQSMPGANPGDWVKPEDLAGILEFICSDNSSSLRETVLKVYNNA
ncbi:MAG TPA: SDR family NAD(P)-dependent oxidoreductase [Flavisolibacter sp.]|nr:SDR family NAD(P)-dependent oxidoreductase [Flavisolibacter sp.]